MYRGFTCPVCDEGMSEDEYIRFGKCTECQVDELIDEVGYGIVYDFLREFREDFKVFVAENYG